MTTKEQIKYPRPETLEDLQQLADAFRGISPGDGLMYQLKENAAIKEWAMKEVLKLEPGDRAIIIDDFASKLERSNGWYPYRECLAKMKTGVVEDIFYNTHSNAWHAVFRPDTTWSVSEYNGGTRYDHPEGKVFYLGVRHLERIPKEKPRV